MNAPVLPPLRLGVNIDHVATVRNARGGLHPDPARAAAMIEAAGADRVTFHLREDRRHIRDADLPAIRAACALPINFECAPTPEMIAIASKLAPHEVLLVPERREERTTEGGLDAAGQLDALAGPVATLSARGIRVSLFIEPDARQIDAAIRLGVPVVELHTGRYAERPASGRATELARLADAAALAARNGIEPHAGHGLDLDNVAAVAAIPQLVELNIGHALVGDAIFTGLDQAVRAMRAAMASARGGQVRSAP